MPADMTGTTAQRTYMNSTVVFQADTAEAGTPRAQIHAMDWIPILDPL